MDLLTVVAGEGHRLHGDKVDDALELVLESDRQLDQHRIVTELFTQLILDTQRVGAGSITLVHKCDARHPVTPHLTVDGERLTLHTGHGTQHQDSAVENAEGALDFDGEVNVPWRVDDVDVVVVPRAVGRRALDGDAALTL
jgi:hypothetical protein